MLDAGALIAFERNDANVRTLVAMAISSGVSLYAPAGVVAQAWRDGRRQSRLARLLGAGVVGVHALDEDEAKAVGALSGRVGSADIVDASVALLARRHRAKVVTSDPRDLRRIDPTIDIVVC